MFIPLRVLWFASLYGSMALCCLTVYAGSDEEHWAFQAIVRPALPKLKGEKQAVVENPIDAFVRARLRAANLSPSPEADASTLLRRLHLDLTGLLPSLEDIATFEKSWKRDAEQAYRRKVDELLASPYFGERWGRHWLDMARYADSDGYLGDTLRPWAWVYRDWVVDAINRDQPFDQFSIEQLAGDLLPGATLQQRIATGFHRNTLLNTEAGVDKELYHTKELVDRVSTTGMVWLGLTLACAECHDHKHDPVTQAEFYQMYAFFNNADEKNIAAPFADELLRYEAAEKKWRRQAGQLERGLAKYENEVLGSLQAQTAWEKQQVLPKVKWKVIHPDKVKSGAGDKMKIEKDGAILVTGKDPDTVTYTVEAVVLHDQELTAFRLQALGKFGRGRERGELVGRGEGGSFVLSSFAVQHQKKGGKSQRLKVDSVRADYAEEDQSLQAVLDTRSVEGWYLAAATRQSHAAVFDLSAPVKLQAGDRLIFTLRNKFGKGKTMRHFRLSLSCELPLGVPSPLSDALVAALAVDEGRRSDQQAEEIRKAYHSQDQEWCRRRGLLEAHLAKPVKKPVTKARAFVERKKDRRKTYIHVRGNYAQHGEQVWTGTPGVLHKLKPRNEGEQADRLDLARWLFDDGNPLTARVAVNQIWQHLFGQGLVATAGDFGTEGAVPTHPELLDWLATEYRQRAWSRKSMIRLMVNSATYRQSSDVRPELADYATGNLLLWRQNSFRASAETVRDIHLAVSGLLSRKMGGPGIRPPLPGFVSEVGRSVKWPVSKGADLYRRGLYIVLKRTVTYPMLSAFDAPDSSVSCSVRDRTNTPMQALTLLNDPVFYECAEVMGRDLDLRYESDVEAAIQEMYQRCLNREPRQEEVVRLISAYSDLSGDTPNREAAMTAVVRIVLNIDEFITRN